MPRFDYARGHSVPEALKLLIEPGLVSRPLAGGTDVVVFVRHEKPPFDRVVDITRVPELKVIERRGDEIVVGAGVASTKRPRARCSRRWRPAWSRRACRWAGRRSATRRRRAVTP